MFRLKTYLQELQENLRYNVALTKELNTRLMKIEKEYDENRIVKRIEKLEETLGLSIKNCDETIVKRINNMEEALHNHINYNDSYNLTAFMPSVESFINNEVAMRQGVLEDSDEYRYLKKFHEILRPHLVENIKFTRVGRDDDGGYIMADSWNGKIAYSLGICDDVSWDLDMAARGYEIFQYDHTIDKLPEENDLFHWFKIGLTGESETDQLKHLDTLIKSNGHENEHGMILKMDIEGYEWGVINQTDENIFNQFDQIVMELHDVATTDKKEEVLSAINKLNRTHAMVNIHANNNVRKRYFSGELVTSDALEITMLNRKNYILSECEMVVPTSRDQLNNVRYPEVFLGKW